MTSIQSIGERVTFLIGGEAGQGITRSGSTLGRALMRAGFHVFGVNDYPSIIRGGHNFYILTASEKEVFSQDDKVDLIIALNKETILLHIDELVEGGGIIYDNRIEFKENEISRNNVKLFSIPLTDIVNEVKGPSIMRNSVGLGAAFSLVGLDLKYLEGVISDAFSGRESIIESNVNVIRSGYEYAKNQYEFKIIPKASDFNIEKILVTGSEAIALGAIGAGCMFYSAYPMTPASPILHYLISKEEESGMVVLQAESEIAAINMAVGASYAGLRSMTATSGGGFCLMTEGFGLAGATENPIVVVLGQRPGPSTGMATYTAQSDLLFAIHSSQGEFPRIVVAPGDIDDAFVLTVEIFNLVEKYQIPAIVMSDKYLLESHKSTVPFDFKSIKIERGGLIETEEWNGEEYRRYKITESGVSPRIILGTKGATMLSNGNEHDEFGFTTIDPIKVVAMADKRFRKSDALAQEISTLDPVKIFGDTNPDITLVGWGSTKGPALEAIRLLKEEGKMVNFIQIVYLEPFPSEAMKEAMKNSGRSLLLETNVTNQLERLVKEKTSIKFDKSFTKYSGRPFNPYEIAIEARRLL